MVATWDIESGMGRALSLVQGICKKVRQLGGTQDDVDRLVKEEGEPTLNQIAELIVGEKEKTKLLEFVTAVSIPAIGHFAARDHFKVGKTDGVKIGWIGDNFREHFLGKVEENVEEAEFKVYKLLHSSLDQSIIAVLGERYETSLAQIWELLKCQPKGEAGTHLTNSYANIFYSRDAKGALWAVSVRWYADYRAWYVAAHSVENPGRWDDAHQVVSR